MALVFIEVCFILVEQSLGRILKEAWLQGSTTSHAQKRTAVGFRTSFFRDRLSYGKENAASKCTKEVPEHDANHRRHL